MNSTTSLKLLRDATVNEKPVIFLKTGQDGTLVKVERIQDASEVKFGDDGPIWPLDAETTFYNDDEAQTLRAVVFCWLHEKSSIVDYKNECLESGIADFKFLVKTELTTWLRGNSEVCAFIRDGKEGEKGKKNGVGESLAVGSNDVQSATVKGKRKFEDAQLERISKFEVESVDHNATLRGSKNIDFGYLIPDAKKFISQLKRSKPTSGGGSSGSGRKTASGPRKLPIIIISPATTSLLALNNIKEFLEHGKFVDPSASTTKKPENGIITISHPSERLQPAAHQITIVDNVDMFTKPEYWDRVVAIFTTGQAWQFAKYKYSRPELLFQRYAGFFVSYEGDVTPKQIKDWNVTELKVGRGDKRFKDKMIVRDFWATIEKVLVSKGYGKLESF